MSRLFYHVMQDNAGNLLFGVSGTMRLAGTGTAATIYGDAALTVPIPNPMTNHPSFGSFKCYLGAGAYDFSMAKSGYTFETLTGLQGWGSMALQDADEVGITGGNIYGLSQIGLGLAGAPPANVRALVAYLKASVNGLTLRPTDNDSGGAYAVVFQNVAQELVGGILTTATGTTYATTSDARLKYAIAPLTGALDVVRALNPITHLWRVDNSPGVGLLAHEVQDVTPEAVTGARDAIDETGQIVPQGVDYTKLVPYLISAVKELTQQVEMLTAQLAAAGA